MIIGGKADGNLFPLKAIDITFEGERYILISFKEGQSIRYFYMLTGMAPAEAKKIYLERQKAG